MSIQRLCKSCGDSYYQRSGLQTICSKCQYNRYAKPKKPMKKLGKVSKQWIEDRQTWIDNHPSSNGTWQCYLGISDDCLNYMDIDNLTLDHVESRGRHPEKRRDQNNLRPACFPCNQLKGSRSLEEVV